MVGPNYGRVLFLFEYELEWALDVDVIPLESSANTTVKPVHWSDLHGLQRKTGTTN